MYYKFLLNLGSSKLKLVKISMFGRHFVYVFMISKWHPVVQPFQSGYYTVYVQNGSRPIIDLLLIVFQEMALKHLFYSSLWTIFSTFFECGFT